MPVFALCARLFGCGKQLAAHKELAQKLAELESRVSGHDEAIA